MANKNKRYNIILDDETNDMLRFLVTYRGSRKAFPLRGTRRFNRSGVIQDLIRGTYLHIKEKENKQCPKR